MNQYALSVKACGFASSPTEGSLWRNHSLCEDCQSLPSLGEVALRSNDGEVIPLFCKNPLQTSPRCGIIYLAASPLEIEYLPL